MEILDKSPRVHSMLIPKILLESCGASGQSVDSGPASYTNPAISRLQDREVIGRHAINAFEDSIRPSSNLLRRAIGTQPAEVIGEWAWARDPLI